MYAGAVEDAGLRLRELRREESSDFALAALAVFTSLVATQVRPAFALPLFLGGVVVGARGLRAAWRRWDIVDRLAGEREALVIPEIRAHALKEASIERRRLFASYIRVSICEPVPSRLRKAVPELRALAAELDDEGLVLDPACAVACARLVSDPVLSPLLNPALPAEDVRSRVHQIRVGFVPRGPAP
jgi:hypothetical protein